MVTHSGWNGALAWSGLLGNDWGGYHGCGLFEPNRAVIFCSRYTTFLDEEVLMLTCVH